MVRSAHGLVLGPILIGVVGILAAGCASGKTQCEGSGCKAIETDLAVGVVGHPADMAAPDDLAPAPPPADMTPLLPFGSPCTSNAQCDSGLCLTTDDGGQYCTQTCTDTCPMGYGCYPVTGVLQPGVATNVCAPENNLLCTSCMSDTDCGAADGADHCMMYPTGTFCGRDCTTIGCPPTYNCTTIAGGDAGTQHQCVPANNACDCTAASNGRTIKCTIMTGQGTSCPGISTCVGATGWGACTAPSTTDLPDDGFVDSNCDGIDGDLENAIFVDAVSGNDGNAGSISAPVASINQGIALAKTKSLVQVLVSKGSYGPVTLSSGIGIYGGYDAGNKWQRANTNVAVIGGGVPAVDANFITKETHVELFTISGTQQGWYGGSSYGVRVMNSSGPVVLRTSTITASDGQPGYGGANGSHGEGSDYNNYGLNYSGMPGNTNSDGSGNYGRGGDGGHSHCGSNGGSGGQASNGGNGGTSGAGAGPQAGNAGGVGGGPVCNSSPISCDCGHSSNPGGGNAGPSGGAGGNGLAAANSGTLSTSDYVPASGGSGSNGVNGTGGSGGGAGGGSTGSWPCDTDEGGGGGGGGAGGCGGTYGVGGSGGGASFAVLSISSTITIDKCVLSSGNGGAGGKGGNGGAGGQGGSYGGYGGGTSDDGDGQPGANGGSGGAGGPGGSGAGGSGGPSASIAGFNSNVAQTRSTLNHGSGGALGPGGYNGANAAPNGSAGVATGILYF
jgi:hypothetical protein